MNIKDVQIMTIGRWYYLRDREVIKILEKICRKGMKSYRWKIEILRNLVSSNFKQFQEQQQSQQDWLSHG